LYCARDRFGIKPLYYLDIGGRFAVASEAKSFTVLPFFSAAIEGQSLHHYMSLMYVPGEATMFANVRRLPPGSVLTYRLDSCVTTVDRWWLPSFSARPRPSVPELVERLRTGFRAAVKRWTISDVPIACLLSGGLDSSAIVGV